MVCHDWKKHIYPPTEVNQVKRCNTDSCAGIKGLRSVYLESGGLINETKKSWEHVKRQQSKQNKKFSRQITKSAISQNKCTWKSSYRIHLPNTIAQCTSKLRWGPKLLIIKRFSSSSQKLLLNGTSPIAYICFDL